MMLLYTPYIAGPVGNPELLVDPGFDDASKWSPPGGVTITSSQAQWRTAGSFSTFWTGSGAANLATLNGGSAIGAATDYEWAVTVENFTGGGNYQCQVTFYDASFAAINTPSNNLNINGTGTFTTTLTAPSNAAYAAWRAKPFSADYVMDWSDASLKAA
ncbi:hypothetical protein [Ruegeria sp. HKCCA4812]|uniref:hypothetical protein n=1 Tax=Ruegeria sp. HKCCA4812 TaxID=2682993 RepID=UPI0014885487|nr:hypothetical protein [Ruegeria sp. HKCCA4812]